MEKLLLSLLLSFLTGSYRSHLSPACVLGEGPFPRLLLVLLFKTTEAAARWMGKRTPHVFSSCSSPADAYKMLGISARDPDPRLSDSDFASPITSFVTSLKCEEKCEVTFWLHVPVTVAVSPPRCCIYLGEIHPQAQAMDEVSLYPGHHIGGVYHSSFQISCSCLSFPFCSAMAADP